MQSNPYHTFSPGSAVPLALHTVHQDTAGIRLGAETVKLEDLETWYLFRGEKCLYPHGANKKGAHLRVYVGREHTVPQGNLKLFFDQKTPFPTDRVLPIDNEDSPILVIEDSGPPPPPVGAGPPTTSTTSSPPPGTRVVSYQLDPGPSPWDPDAPIPTIYVTEHLQLFNLDPLPENPEPLRLVDIHSQTHDISHDVLEFLRYRIFDEQTEDGRIGSNNPLLSVMVNLIPECTPARNRTSTTTLPQTRPDCYLERFGVPIFLVEEKADVGDLALAKSELKEKLIWVPHYFQVRALPVLAIAGNRFAFGQLNRVTEGFEELRTFNCSTMAGRLGCLSYAINLCRLLISLPIATCDIRLFRAIPRGRSTITITSRGVFKSYTNKHVQSKLRQFYKDVKYVPCLEKMANFSTKDGFLLQPVGIKYPPTTANDQIVFLRDILTALEGIHQAGWTHCDIRPSNIIFFPHDGHYYVIDCEFATKFGDTLPTDSRALWGCPQLIASARADLFSLSHMIPPSLSSFAEFVKRASTAQECLDKLNAEYPPPHTHTLASLSFDLASSMGGMHIAPQRKAKREAMELMCPPENDCE
eukprot:gnl/Trimastix_PCT/2.p1 GENE.gnl/Trimastix_PCT/2~~gnl/Trimastix_PCT/2.p1  ORF type:complete len:584 (-),score=43.92 gnl/Trimastix_PCT/2:1425-3176(-)